MARRLRKINCRSSANRNSKTPKRSSCRRKGGSLSYAFQVEVQPEFTLPELNGLKIKKPKIDVTDENVQQAMTNLREQQGALVPVEDRGVEPKDFLYADVHVKLGR